MKRRPTTKILANDPLMENGRTVAADLVARMFADYQGGLSLAKVGEKYRRTRQSIFVLFENRGFKLRSKVFQKPLVYGGRRYTPDKNGYWRDTVLRSAKYYPGTLLHRRKWMDRHGPIPPGHDVVFKDGNRRNVRLSNLKCMSHAEQQALGRTGHNQFTVSAGARLDLLLGNHNDRRPTRAVLLKAA